MICSLSIPACMCHFPPYSLNYLIVACTCLEFLYISKLRYIFTASTKIWIGVPNWPCHKIFNKIITVIRADTLLWVLAWILQYQNRYSANPKRCLMSWARDPMKPQRSKPQNVSDELGETAIYGTARNNFISEISNDPRLRIASLTQSSHPHAIQDALI